MLTNKELYLLTNRLTNKACLQLQHCWCQPIQPCNHRQKGWQKSKSMITPSSTSMSTPVGRIQHTVLFWTIFETNFLCWPPGSWFNSWDIFENNRQSHVNLYLFYFIFSMLRLGFRSITLILNDLEVFSEFKGEAKVKDRSSQ
jgi:hypothetical protein